MTNFSDVLNKGTDVEIRKERQLRYRLADASLEHFKTADSSGRDIYSALSQLSTISELDINMAHYDNLMFVDGALVQPEVYYYAVSKLRELETLLQES